MDGPTARRAHLRDLFTRLIHAFGRKDFDTFGSFIAPDCLFDWPYLPLEVFPSEVTGRDIFIAMSKAGMTNCDGYNHQVDTFYDQLDPDMVIVEYHSGAMLADIDTHYANKYLGILRFSGDLVVYWREYVNPLPIIKAYGLDFKNEAAPQ
jgi:ketosteroid isomerase-like protein